ncbi:class I SAM-dependent methyltransferase [Geomonas azotofigens]|uniref:class I SAM-dependent methyltransferase n=1 Tax=Geomonas azotofigens TaxID=2843196 RepID=UPI001C11DBF5|nr:class I SAM-dependent methyltransferase [Geomonas azotofigens]MBU5612541.1 class I SAM-dependent methyltransferase [Geomonas azotofigens]
MSERIDYNSRIHNLIAPVYEARHAEIFNESEQARIRAQLRFALESIDDAPAHPRVLDFGAGTGNLTRHLLELGARVVASDVSSGCLKELKAMAGGSGHLELSLLNGRDLSQFADGSFDMVAVYSVLHHVPDYLGVIEEFVRVLKPGGVVYLDHEVCPDFWGSSPDYQAYQAELGDRLVAERQGLGRYLLGILRRRNRWRYLAAALYLRWRTFDDDEGDIHTHPDDHIEWDRIRMLLEPRCEVLRELDYLVCRERSVPAGVWEKWHARCADMRLLIARKR